MSDILGRKAEIQGAIKTLTQHGRLKTVEVSLLVDKHRLDNDDKYEAEVRYQLVKMIAVFLLGQDALNITHSPDKQSELYEEYRASLSIVIQE